MDTGGGELGAADATARSQVATSWQPAAVAVASTAAITGCGSRRMASIMALQLSMMCLT